MNMPHIFTVVLLACSGFNASAEPVSTLGPGWYVGIGAGRGEVEVGAHDRRGQVDSILLEQAYDPTSSQGSEDDGTDTLRLNLGYRFDAHWAAELNWIDLGSTDGEFHSEISAPVNTAITGEVESEYQSVSISGLGFYPIGWGLSLFGRLGVHHWEHDHRFNSSDSQLGFRDKVHTSGNDIVWGGGLSYMPSLNIEFRIEWERFAGVEDEDGIDNRSLSLVYHF